MKARGRPKNENTADFENKLFRVRSEAARQFNILKAEEGKGSGPRLISEALNLLFKKYGKPPIGFP